MRVTEGLMFADVPAVDGEELTMRSQDQEWLVSWHSGAGAPAGDPHGASGVCLSGDGDLVLVSADGRWWGLPAGRPEAGETVEQTLTREMREEACVEVLDARLLGYARSECRRGREKGRVLVRSFWLAGVRVDAWEPEYEIPYRRLVPSPEAARYVSDPSEAIVRVQLRALAEAGLHT